MAQIEKQLSERARKAVAKQIGSAFYTASSAQPDANYIGILPLSASASEGTAALKESFPIWYLEAADIGMAQPDDDLQKWARRSRHWHHQVEIGGRAQAFARSRSQKPGGSPGEVEEFYQSPAAREIERAIAWLDANVDDDWQTRLLEVPSRHLLAFWLVQDGNPESRILVVDAPDEHATFAAETLYPSHQFLQMLRASTPIRGFTFADE